MAANLEKLQADLKEKVKHLIEHCRNRGIEMRPYNGLRDPFVQARLWRQSRSIEEITKAIALLESKKAPFLANCLKLVGAQYGDHVTDAMPGFSWHQWGEAVDCFWIVAGKAEWSTKKLVNGLNGYKVYAEEAKALNLTAGGLWTNFKDWPHIQLRKADSALSIMSYQEIDDEMKAKFGA